jgi:hypothetical protein
MNASDLLLAFDLAARIWSKQEAADTYPQDLLDAANTLELAIMEMATHIPAASADDLAAKEKIADHIDHVLDGCLTEGGEPITVDLRRSIAGDRACAELVLQLITRPDEEIPVADEALRRGWPLTRVSEGARRDRRRQGDTERQGGREMTFSEIDDLYLEAADLVARHGERFMPIFDRSADEREKALARGSRLQDALTRLQGRTVAPSAPAMGKESENCADACRWQHYARAQAALRKVSFSNMPRHQRQL